MKEEEQEEEGPLRRTFRGAAMMFAPAGEFSLSLVLPNTGAPARAGPV